MWILLLLAVPVILVLLLLGFAVAAIVAMAVAVFAHLIPLLLILAGVWLLVRAVFGSPRDRRSAHDRRASGPGQRQHHQRRQSERRPSPAQSGQQQPRQPARPPRRELPIDVQVKVEQIKHKADVLLGYADRFSPLSQDLYIVQQTAAEYLPRTVAAYLAVPGTDDPMIAATGRTVLQELRAQLELLDSKLDDISQNLQRQDLDGLLANRRFLEERFGLHERPADIDGGRRTAGAA